MQLPGQLDLRSAAEARKDGALRFGEVIARGFTVSQENMERGELPEPVSCAASARRTVVFPVCRGAWTTK